ncbi:ABC transporter ATP-binding protein [Schaalia suimastitidis]|uniref:ABC transporter ATP-binding protein n=1 Tax=Schaalia suimastitidis TaxID=121163 RepID=UPI0004282C8F|nr:ABC transporter ATP-binding protein [Schaalia suimastitidis]
MMRQFAELIDRPVGLYAHIVAHVLSGVFQGVALLMLIPVVQAATSGGDGLALSLVAPVLCALCAFACNIYGSLTGFRIGSFDICGTLIRKIAERVQHLPLGYFDATTTGRITAATSTGVNTLAHLPSIVLPYVAQNIGTAVTILIGVVVWDWHMGLALLLSVPVGIWALYLLRRAVIVHHNAHAVAIEELSGRVLEFSRMQAVLRASDPNIGRWNLLTTTLVQEHRATDRAGGAKGPAASLFHLGVLLAVLCAISIGLAHAATGRLSFAVCIVLTLLAVRFAEPIGMVAFYVDALHECSVALKGITSVMHAEVLPEPREVDEDTGGTTGGITLNDVTFGYRDDTQVLHDVDLVIPRGQVTALVGPSGSGKSTLLRLVARFWDPNRGTIKLGDADLRDFTTAALMSRISVVFQHVYLFDTSIEENIRIGRPDATSDEIQEAARLAGLSEVIERLPARWDTRVGEGGNTLSGGQRQRVALARAILKDSDVVLLDEVTSSLDGVNEGTVAQAIEKLAEDRTVLVIAHRLSTIRRADQIVVLNDGRIEDSGTHQALYERDGTYRQFWDDQSDVERWHLT